MLRYLIIISLFFSSPLFAIEKSYNQLDSDNNVSQFDPDTGIWLTFRGSYDSSFAWISAYDCYKGSENVNTSYYKEIEKNHSDKSFSQSFSRKYSEVVCYVDWEKDLEKYTVQSQSNKQEMFFTYALYFCPSSGRFTQNNLNASTGCDTPYAGGIDAYCTSQPPIESATSNAAWRDGNDIFTNFNGCKYEAHGVIVGVGSQYSANWRPVGVADKNHSSGGLDPTDTPTDPTDPTNPTDPTDPTDPNNGSGSVLGYVRNISNDVSDIKKDIHSSTQNSYDIKDLLKSNFESISPLKESAIYKSIDSDFDLNGDTSFNIIRNIQDNYVPDFLSGLNGGALNNLSDYQSKYGQAVAGVGYDIRSIASSVGSGVDSLDFGDDYSRYMDQTDFLYKFKIINSIIPQYKECQPITYFEGYYSFTLECSEIEKIRVVLFYVFFFYTLWFVFTKFSTILTNRD